MVSVVTYALKPLDAYAITRDDIDTVLVPSKHLTEFIQGDGNVTYICQNCRQTILDQIRQGQVANIVFECPTCGSLLYLPRHQ